METLYKLTRPDLTTYHNYQWRLGEERIFPGTGRLCGPGWCHAYLTPELAVILNPIHAAYAPFKLFRAEGDIGVRDSSLKVGCSKFRLCEEIIAPKFTPDQLSAFSIWCAQAVYTGNHKNPWHAWATNWLAGKDRGYAAACDARAATDAAARDARDARAAADAAYATYAAADAAYATYVAAYAVYATYAARAAADAAARDARAAARDARAAADAAAYAAYANITLELPKLAREALWFEV